MPSLTAEDPVERERQAEQWCDRFAANTEKWLKSTVATWREDEQQPELNYEDVDTSLIAPRPRLYGLVGGDVIEKVWKARSEQAQSAAGGNGSPAAAKPASTS